MIDPLAQQDHFDFKPFFDLAVGMLFILLIMVSAQLFFMQWDRPVNDLENRRKAELREIEVGLLLERAAERLRRDGYTAIVNRDAVAISVTMPFQNSVSAVPSFPLSTVDTLADTLNGVLGCAVISGHAPGCQLYDHVALVGIGIALAGPVDRDGARNQTAALGLGADLVRHAPALVKLKTEDGRTVVRLNVTANGPGNIQDGQATISLAIQAK
jgi:hypothetical protein